MVLISKNPALFPPTGLSGAGDLATLCDVDEGKVLQFVVGRLHMFALLALSLAFWGTCFGQFFRRSLSLNRLCSSAIHSMASTRGWILPNSKEQRPESLYLVTTHHRISVRGTVSVLVTFQILLWQADRFRGALSSIAPQSDACRTGAPRLKGRFDELAGRSAISSVCSHRVHPIHHSQSASLLTSVSLQWQHPQSDDFKPTKRVFSGLAVANFRSRI